ncbi:MAG: DUF6737 family protein [Cyanobacteria bacterium J06631_6]
MKTGNPESINVWDYKPGWCQPWSIMLTGITIIAGSWLVLHRVWITAMVTLPIIAWWIYFLLIYPKAFAEYISVQRSTLESKK